MKAKNVILGLSALVFAIGSAFTTVNADFINEQIKVRTEADQNPLVCEDDIVCVPITLTGSCTGGSQNCFATVNSDGLPGDTDDAFIRNSSCAVLTTGSNNNVSTLTDEDGCIVEVDPAE